MASPVRSPGYRLIYMAEVAQLCEWFRQRDTPLARELCDALEAEWETRYAAAQASTAFPFYPVAATAAELLSQALGELRQGGPE